MRAAYLDTNPPHLLTVELHLGVVLHPVTHVLPRGGVGAHSASRPLAGSTLHLHLVLLRQRGAGRRREDDVKRAGAHVGIRPDGDDEGPACRSDDRERRPVVGLARRAGPSHKAVSPARPTSDRRMSASQKGAHLHRLRQQPDGRTTGTRAEQASQRRHARLAGWSCRAGRTATIHEPIRPSPSKPSSIG